MSTRREATKSRDGQRRGRSRGANARTGARTGSADPTSRRGRGRAGKPAASGRESRLPRSGPQTSPIPRPVDRPARPKNTSQAKARAKARKAKAPKVIRPKLTERLAARLAEIDLRPRTLLGRVPFVVLVIGALGVGLGLTLWLSTDAAERSYQLSHARERTRILQQQKEALERDVREASSAPALAEAARKQGMIPTRDTAHLVQAPDGTWVVVGSPKPADGVPPPPLNAKLPDETPPPPASPPVTPPEVAVRVLPTPGAPTTPARPGPQVLLRGPDGASTVDPHLVAPVPGQLPAQGPTVPGQVPTVPGQVPGQVPGSTVPGQVTTVPGQVPNQIPTAPAQIPTAPTQMPDIHGPVSDYFAPPPAPPPALAPAAVPAAPAPGNVEQFGPVTPTAPATPGTPR
ncbi:hypothetical protein A5634_18075 [Mycobacterium asiaticum]|uniref:Uncharacterized protein n=1 Tax=Mycobacterium asiaticum TaxID=1790 RepID=A0A1A3PAK6_MYCAS|nr:hypothetical protein [Mycobacterium asiaticum]OBK29627.1 hypothetical protein A5634_18075 [Mycobacterium asiaticum]